MFPLSTSTFERNIEIVTPFYANKPVPKSCWKLQTDKTPPSSRHILTDTCNVGENFKQKKEGMFQGTLLCHFPSYSVQPKIFHYKNQF